MDTLQMTPDRTRGWPDGETGTYQPLPSADDDSADDDSADGRGNGDRSRPSEGASPSGSRPRPARNRGGPGGELAKATVRRVLDRYAAVRALSVPDLRLVANLLGVEPDAYAVTEAALSGGRGGTGAALKDLRDVSGAQSDMDALLAAVELGPERVRALNNLVGTITGASPLRLHSAHAKAARQVVVTVRGLDAQVPERVDRLASLFE